MKNKKATMRFTLMTLLFMMCMASISSAQNCSGNKVWACRLDECGFQECKCVSANNAQSWMATVPPCNNNWWQHCCHGMTWRAAQDGSGLEFQMDFMVSPNPVTSASTISFFLSRSQQVSIHVLDINGRKVAALASQVFEEGVNGLTWNPAGISPGIYFLQLQSEENSAMTRITVIQ